MESNSGEQVASPAHVLVVGAGIVGVSTALRLLRGGARVTLVDRLPPGEGASYGNAGVLATSSILPVTMPGLVKKIPSMLLDPNGPLFLRWSYLPKLLPWLTRYLRYTDPDRVRYIAEHLGYMTSDSLDEHLSLARGTPAEAHIRTTAYAFAYRSEASFAADGFAWRLREEHGIPFEVLHGDEARQVEPALAPHYQMVVVVPHQHGTIDSPGDYVKALAAVFATEGGTVQVADVASILTSDGSAIGLRCANGTELTGDRVVVATGAWSNRILDSVGVQVPLESERGYHIELYGASIELNHAVMVADAKFVATSMSGRLRLAGLVEFGGLDGPPSTKPWELLRRRVEEVFPGIEYEYHKEWMGHRPATTDSLPLVGESGKVRGLFLAFGHHHVGLTCGPKTGRLTADLVLGRPPNVDLAPFSPTRFNA